MEAFGAPPEEIDAAVAAERELLMFDVYEENVLIVSTFEMLATQWRVAMPGMGGAVWLGLDYAAIPALPAMRAATPEEYTERFSGLRLMESAAQGVLNRRADDE